MSKRLDEFGRELLDDTPMRLPTGLNRPETLAEQIQRLVRTTVSAAAAEAGYETFEEADDFDIEDDPLDPNTPFETFFDPVLKKELTPQEFNERQDYYREEYLKTAKGRSEPRPAAQPGEQDRPPGADQSTQSTGSEGPPTPAPEKDSA